MMKHHHEKMSEIASGKNSPEDQNPNAETSTVWRPPTVSVIDIKRTLLLAGSGSDLSGRTTT